MCVMIVFFVVIVLGVNIDVLLGCEDDVCVEWVVFCFVVVGWLCCVVMEFGIGFVLQYLLQFVLCDCFGMIVGLLFDCGFGVIVVVFGSFVVIVGICFGDVVLVIDGVVLLFEFNLVVLFDVVCVYVCVDVVCDLLV